MERHAVTHPWPLDSKGRRLTLAAVISAIPAQGPRGNIGDETAARVVARLRELEIVEQSNGQ